MPGYAPERLHGHVYGHANRHVHRHVHGHVYGHIITLPSWQHLDLHLVAVSRGGLVGLWPMAYTSPCTPVMVKALVETAVGITNEPRGRIRKYKDLQIDLSSHAARPATLGAVPRRSDT